MLSRVLSYSGIFLLYLLSLLPLSLLYLLADLCYYLLFYVIGYRRKVVRTNLLLAFPEKDSTAIHLIEKRFYKYLAALIVEIIKMATISPEEMKKRFAYKNIEQISSFLDRNESILICAGHYGNWEWGTLSIGLHLNITTCPIYKPLSNKVFDQWFYKIRSRFGNRMVAMRQTFRAISETKNEVTAFCFASDQAPPKAESHEWITFLNQQTSVLFGIEKIALKTNRPVFYFKVNVIKKGYYEVDIIPVTLDPKQTNGHEITELHIRLLEDDIKDDPAYWLWSHRRWKHQPTPLL